MNLFNNIKNKAPRLTAKDAARQYRAAGLSVLPIKPDGSKSPAIKSWTALQQQHMREEDIESAFPVEVGVGIICGAISGNLEVIDADDKAAEEKWLQLVKDMGGQLILDRLPTVGTPRGTHHRFYKCAKFEGNQKLAQRFVEGENGSAPQLKVLIETRGQGGYVLAPGCPPLCHPTGQTYEIVQGDLSNIPEITQEERELLLTSARSLNEHFPQQEIVAGPKNTRAGGEANRPGDDFNDRGSWDFLKEKGWTETRPCYWRKPGDTGPGHHATTGHAGQPLFYCFSTAAYPFEAGKAYSRFAAYTLLSHGGDYALAAKHLASEGYGQAPQIVVSDIQKGDQPVSPPSLRGADQKPLSDWPAVIAFEIEVPPNEPYPVAALGETLAGAAAAIHAVVKSPAALSAQGVLAATNLACAGHADIEIDGRRYPNTDYFVSVGVSGERKSATDSAALSSHRELEKQLRTIYNAEKKEYDNPSKTDKGDPPAPPVIVVGDVSMEGLQSLYEKGLSRAGVFTQEAGNILGGWSLKDENRIRTGAILSGFWDGRVDPKVRASSGLAVLAGRRLTAHLGCQPSIAVNFLGARDLQGQGLPSRILPAWPESTIGSRLYEQTTLLTDARYKRFCDQMATLLSAKLPKAPGRPGELEPTVMELAPHAKAIWIKFHDALEKDAGRGGKLFPIQFFACKAAEHALRLSSILSPSSGDKVISPDTMASAIALMEWYVKEWQRIQTMCRTEAATGAAQTLLLWLKTKKLAQFVPADVYQKGPTELRSASAAHPAISELEKRHYIRPISVERDGKRVSGFEVRPDV